jgi:hypothetical protein
MVLPTKGNQWKTMGGSLGFREISWRSTFKTMLARRKAPTATPTCDASPRRPNPSARGPPKSWMRPILAGRGLSEREREETEEPSCLLSSRKQKTRVLVVVPGKENPKWRRDGRFYVVENGATFFANIVPGGTGAIGKRWGPLMIPQIFGQSEAPVVFAFVGVPGYLGAIMPQTASHRTHPMVCGHSRAV